MVMLFTQLSLIFLDLNYKHTSIFQLHISPTYRVPLDHYYYSSLSSRASSAIKKPLNGSLMWQYKLDPHFFTNILRLPAQTGRDVFKYPYQDRNVRIPGVQCY